MYRFLLVLCSAILLLSLAGCASAASTVGTSMIIDERDYGARTQTELLQKMLVKMGVSDVDPSSNEAFAITVLAQNSILPPRPNGAYEPNTPATAAEIVSAVSKILGIAEKNDTPESACKKAEVAGLVSSTLPGSMTRLDFACLLADALGIPPDKSLDSFLDTALLSKDSRSIVYHVCKLGLLEAYPDNTFHPDEIVTRLQLSVYLGNIIGLKPNK